MHILFVFDYWVDPVVHLLLQRAPWVDIFKCYKHRNTLPPSLVNSNTTLNIVQMQPNGWTNVREQLGYIVL